MRISARPFRLVSVAALFAVLSCSCGHSATKLAIDDRATPTPTSATMPTTTTTTVDKNAVTRWNRAVWNNAVWVNAVKHAERASHANSSRSAAGSGSFEAPRTSANIASAGSVNGYPCGGDLPSCCTLQHESGGNPTVVEGHGSPYTHASGLWQFLASTWANYRGYPYASAAPWQVQNERAAIVFDHGRGASNWYGDGCYGGR